MSKPVVLLLVVISSSISYVSFGTSSLEESPGMPAVAGDVCWDYKKCSGLRNAIQIIPSTSGPLGQEGYKVYRRSFDSPVGWLVYESFQGGEYDNTWQLDLNINDGYELTLEHEYPGLSTHNGRPVNVLTAGRYREGDSIDKENFSIGDVFTLTRELQVLSGKSGWHVFQVDSPEDELDGDILHWRRAYRP